jgi:hypothetical protein
MLARFVTPAGVQTSDRPLRGIYIFIASAESLLRMKGFLEFFDHLTHRGGH